MSSKLLLATNNQGKIREYRSLLKEIPFTLVSLADEGITGNIEEMGDTFEENARLKANFAAAESSLLSIADDSGLEVDALGGEPGVHSHRFAGENASDADRIDYLLSRMRDVPESGRSARFRCVIAIATPDGEVGYCSGECRGVIATTPKGDRNFGYDPVFYVPELGRTMAELTMEEKNRISHRAEAARQVPDLLKRPPFSAYS